VALVLGAALSTGLGPLGHAALVKAGTAETMESQLLTSINSYRTARGLRPYYLQWQLIDMSGDRAAIMAAHNTLSHTIAGCLSCQLVGRSIQYYSAGEVIGETGWPWGTQAATSLFNAWKASSIHWNMLMSSSYNYVGIGVAYNATYHTTYASIVMTEAYDQSRPWSRITSGKASGTTASWTWTGADTWLQTHTSGLKNYDLVYKVDSGSWTRISTGTTGTSLSLTSRARGHWYGLRVLSRDNQGNVSLWSAEMWIWIP
jgi:hypothetical protein